MTEPTTGHTIRLLNPAEISDYETAGWTQCARDKCRAGRSTCEPSTSSVLPRLGPQGHRRHPDRRRAGKRSAMNITPISELTGRRPGRVVPDGRVTTMLLGIAQDCLFYKCEDDQLIAQIRAAQGCLFALHRDWPENFGDLFKELLRALEGEHAALESGGPLWHWTVRIRELLDELAGRPL